MRTKISLVRVLVACAAALVFTSRRPTPAPATTVDHSVPVASLATPQAAPAVELAPTATAIAKVYRTPTKAEMLAAYNRGWRPPAGRNGVQGSTGPSIVRVLDSLTAKYPVTPEQLAELAKSYSEIKQRHAELEVSLLTRNETGPRSVEILIPAYQEQGKQLKSDLRAALVAVLGEQNGTQSFNENAQLLNSEFQDFGYGPQKITVTAVQDERFGTLYNVEHFSIRPTPAAYANLDGAAWSSYSSVLTSNTLGNYQPLAVYFPK